MKFIYLFALILFTSCAQTDVAPSPDQGASYEDEGQIDLRFNFPMQKKTLSNGLTVILVKNEKLPIFSYYTFFEVGGKHEVAGITGATHYLEHMMFKGAKKYGAGRFDKIIEGSGGSSNAYTTNDLTVYYESMPADKLELIIDVEADRLGHLLLEEDSFEKERLVVLEERKMRYENSPRGQLYLNMMKYMFEGTPYGTSVIGNIPDLKSVTRDQMMEYFKKFYAPNNATVVVVGSIDLNKTMKMIERYYGQLEGSDQLVATKKEREQPGLYRFQGEYDRKIWLHGNAARPMFILSYQGVPAGHRDAYVLDILSSILGDGKSSYLQQKFVRTKKPQLANVYAANYNLQHAGLFFIGGELMKGIGIVSIERQLKRSLKSACKHAITDRSVQKVKNQYLVGFYSGLETNSGIASLLGNSKAFYQDPMHFLKELEIYRSIEPDEVKKACVRYLRDDTSLFINVWDKNKK